MYVRVLLRVELCAYHASATQSRLSRSMTGLLRPKTYRARYPRWLVGKPLLLTASALCSLGDALFGYSQGCISSALVQPSFIKRMYGVQDITLDRIASGNLGVNEYGVGEKPSILTCSKNADILDPGMTVACLNVTALIASVVAASICDDMGRRAAMRIGSLLCFAAAIIQTFAPNLVVFIAGRCIQGLAVGILAMAVPVVQAEIAPGHARGIFITVENLFLNTG